MKNMPDVTKILKFALTVPCVIFIAYSGVLHAPEPVRAVKYFIVLKCQMRMLAYRRVDVKYLNTLDILISPFQEHYLI